MYSLMLSYLMLVIAMQSSLFLWISLITILFVLWRFLYQVKITTLPTTGVINILAIICSLLIFYFSLSAGVLPGMINLLLIGCAMKLLILSSIKEVKNLSLAFYFIIASAFIFKQGIGFTIYIYTIFMINTYSLLIVLNVTAFCQVNK